MENENNEHEIVPEDLDDSVVAEEAQSDAIKKLREKLKASEAKAKEYLDGWQRAQADFANMRKRDEEEKREFAKYATSAVAEGLIPVLDSFNIALSQGHQDLEPLYNQLFSVLKSSGLEELNPEGEMFDPRLHEAVSSSPTENSAQDQKISKVLQKGYALSGKIIRPAKVIIYTHNG